MIRRVSGERGWLSRLCERTRQTKRWKIGSTPRRRNRGMTRFTDFVRSNDWKERMVDFFFLRFFFENKFAKRDFSMEHISRAWKRANPPTKINVFASVTKSKNFRVSSRVGRIDRYDAHTHTGRIGAGRTSVSNTRSNSCLPLRSLASIFRAFAPPHVKLRSRRHHSRS